MTPELTKFLAAAAVAMGALAAAPDAQANQCILNKGEYRLEVLWFKPRDLTLLIDASQVGQSTWRQLGMRVGSAFHSRTIVTGDVACSDVDEIRTAVVIVVNSFFPAQTRLSNAMLTHIDVVNGVEQARGVLNSATVARNLRVNASRDVWSGPNVPHLVVTPPTDRYVDVRAMSFGIFDGFGGLLPPAN